MGEVYKAIAAVQGELAKTGITKDGVNSSQNYRFRGIDQVYGALSPLLAKHGLCVLPRIIDREMMERVTIKEWNGQKKESVLFYVTVTAEFDFVATADGSTHTVRTYGEAMDSGDKATNKAMSAAYKYAAFMAFAIPTEGDNDADAHTHEVEASPKPAKRADKPVCITPDQEIMLQDKGNEVGQEWPKFLKWAGIKALKDLPADKFAEAMALLNKKAAPKTNPQASELLDDEIPY